MTMPFRFDDTIAAIATAPGPSAHGIIRLSGKAIREVLEEPFVPDDATRLARTRFAERHPGLFRFSTTSEPLLAELYLWPTSRSYTGEPLAELHTVGSPPLLEAVLSTVCESGARLAEPGEFTLRAFLSGRIDLVQAEAVLGTIDAAGRHDLKTALTQLAGGISGRIVELRHDLLALLADLEAGLDFVEDDIEFVSRMEVLSKLNEARVFIAALAEQSSSRMRSTGRRHVVLGGLPNAGKSTLFNKLAGDEAALVSPTAGTTRDYLTVELNLEGVAIELIDTAGYESSDSVIATGIPEESAQRLRSEQFQQADLVIWCTPADLEPEYRLIDEQRQADLQTLDVPLLTISTKSDLGEVVRNRHGVSVQDDQGIDELRTQVAARLATSEGMSSELLGTTAARCRDSLTSAAAALLRAIEAVSLGEELVALELREALDHVGRVVGAVYTDDILDRVFSKFCIGK
jgi:tRNA modification GTPase